MKIIIVFVLGLLMSGCSLFVLSSKRAPEVVPSCFSDGENQGAYCKSQRVNEDGKIVTTRCIGTQNQESKAPLRGKCVEKTCSEGSNTDCQVKGEFSVLEQYAELVTAKLFASDEEASGKESLSTKGKIKAVVVAVSTPVPTPTPEPTSEKAAVKPSIEKPPIQMILKPVKKSRAPTRAKEVEKRFKKICVAKNDKAAPQIFRGKCAIRNCAKGKCSYQGRKEIFEWMAKAHAEGE